jgi:DNA-binding transcriptional ArsR family regulator
MALDLDTAASLLDQLGNQTRLPASTLSHHLSHLRSAGVVWQEREGTLLHCFVDFKMVSELVDFLTAECCVDMPAANVRRRAAG